MQPHVHSNAFPDLDTFLAANLGRILDDDAGPWVGQAALLSETRDAMVPLPAGWEDAINAALDPH